MKLAQCNLDLSLKKKKLSNITRVPKYEIKICSLKNSVNNFGLVYKKKRKKKKSN